MIEGIGSLGRGLRFAEVLQDSPKHGSNVLHGSFLVGRIAIQRNAVLWVSLKTVLQRTFPLNCNKEPFCNICERFEAGRKFAVFTATSTSLQQIRLMPDFFSPWQAGKAQTSEPNGEDCHGVIGEADEAGQKT